MNTPQTPDYSNQDNQQPNHILIVDDDRRIRQLLTRYLRRQGLLVSAVACAALARQSLRAMVFDLIILDVLMPGEDGLSFITSLRCDHAIPVLMLSACDAPADRIAGLRQGADDYLPKPFEPEELLMRVRSILKRSHGAPPMVAFGDFCYNPGREQLFCHDRLIRLSASERLLLSLLVSRHGHPLRRDDWPGCRSLDMTVLRLRSKIETDPKKPQYVQTMRGQGYVLRTRPLAAGYSMEG